MKGLPLRVTSNIYFLFVVGWFLMQIASAASLGQLRFSAIFGLPFVFYLNLGKLLILVIV